MVQLKRKKDYQLLDSMDEKLDKLVTGQAVLCEKVCVQEATTASQGKRVAILEKVAWTAIGGGTIVLFIMKVMVK